MECSMCLTVLTDSTTVASQIRKEGGIRSKILLLETDKLLRLVYSLQSVLKPIRLPGVYNTLADRLSRNLALPEWHLTEEATSAIFKRWGTPEVDLFASHRSAVVPSYVTLDPSDPLALFTDAFSRPWVFNLAWIFPPSPHGPETPGTSIGPVQYNQVQLI
uniref:Uncharacterized protein n=1 Tax=Cacopsylla melanoneura TaxID=428564 RepID=A0A8D8S6S7_9HEMI